MEKLSFELPPEIAEVFDLGMVLGQNQALALVASRCSAAQAEGLCRLRQEGKFGSPQELVKHPKSIDV